MPTIDISALDLAALLCSKVCHDVIGPVGAIRNGLEVLEEEKDATMRDFALDLIRKSSSQAAARLQFARLAFGASGSAGAAIDLGDAEQVAKGHLNDEKHQITWTGPRQLLPKNKVKLLLNLFLVARDCVPRGGTIAATIRTEGDTCWYELAAKGMASRMPPNVVMAVTGEREDALDVHVVQPWYTGMIARESGMKVRFSQDGDVVTIKAEPV